jgi:hypothetical protein
MKKIQPLALLALATGLSAGTISPTMSCSKVASLPLPNTQIRSATVESTAGSALRGHRHH